LDAFASVAMSPGNACIDPLRLRMGILYARHSLQSSLNNNANGKTTSKANEQGPFNARAVMLARLLNVVL
jgi:hypothetical protein